MPAKISDDKETTKARIKSNSITDEATGCWIWSLSLQGNGYGQIKHTGKMKRAHRVSYEAFIGEIPDGKEVMHGCDNRACVNPAHLEIGSHQQNMADMQARGRVRKGPSHPRFGRPGNLGSSNNQSIPVEIDGVRYGGIKEAERAKGVSHGSVRYWIKTGKATQLTKETLQCT